jgi:hypothetical protein
MSQPLTYPAGTLSPSEGERERVRGPFIESRFMERRSHTPSFAFA